MSVRQDTRRDPETGTARRFWMVDVDLELPNGQRKRIRKVSPVQSRRGAEEYERQLRGELLAGTFRVKEVLAPTLAQFAREFMETHATVSNKPSELAAKESILRLHLGPEMGHLRIDQITELEIAKFKAAQKLRGLSNKSINNQLIVLRTLLGKAVEWKKLGVVPRVQKLPASPPKIDFLAPAEAERLIRGAGGSEWQAAVIVALNTGLRLGELLGLQWGDCDLVAAKLTVRRSIWQGHVGTPKSGKERTIALNVRALAALKGQRHLRGPWVWSRPSGEACNKDDFKLALGRARKRSGLRDFEWHTLRHSFASHLVMRDVPLRAVQELLGHASIVMTMRYSHLTPDVGQRAVDALMTPVAASLEPDGNTVSTATPAQTETAPIYSIEAVSYIGSGGRI